MLLENSTNPTNLELYVWLRSLIKTPASLHKVSAFVKCPLLPALVERRIPDAILPFMENMEAGQVAEVKYSLAEREYAAGNTDKSSQLTSESLAALSAAQPESLELRAKLLRLGGAIEQRKELGNAEIVKSAFLPVKITFDSGKVENYLVQWAGAVSPERLETGSPAEPLRGSFLDTRRCQWKITSEVTRKVYFVDDQNEVSTEDAVTKLFSVGAGNQGSDFVLSQMRPENCNDAAPRFASDLIGTKSLVEQKFPLVVGTDKGQVAVELRKLPHVESVTFGSPIN
jgi:hypothetical protein